MPTLTPFLMFEKGLEEAIAFYTTAFPDSRIEIQSGGGQDSPVTWAEFVVVGQRFLACVGGPSFRFTEGLSLFLLCEDQAEVDLYWERFLAAGSVASRGGWLEDPFGISWQVIPRRFTELMSDPNPLKARAVMEAMIGMSKPLVDELERAYHAA